MKKNRYDISVIVPIYNASNFLYETLDSLVNQTIFNQLEIILVNDGSTDNSKDICEIYCQNYDNIRLINQKNGGVSSARNTGLKNVNGTYVTFMDSDDLIKNDLYEKELEEVLSNNYDLLVVDFEKIHNDGSIKKYRKSQKKEWFSSDAAIIDFFRGIIGGQVVDKLFLYDNIKTIFFSSEYKIGEDMLFMYKAIKKSKKIGMNTYICGYQYIVRESSAMTGRFSYKYFDPIFICKYMVDDCSNNKELLNYAQAHLIHESCKVLEYIYRHNSEIEYSEMTDNLKKNIDSYSIINAFRYLIKKQFCGFLLIRISPKLYMLFHRIMHIG